MKLEEIKRRIDELLLQADELIKTKTTGKYGEFVDYPLRVEFIAASKSFLSSLLGKNSTYYEEFLSVEKGSGSSGISACKSILTALKKEVEGGWLFTVKGLVSAEIFTDFLEMAEHLLKEGYKDPAAVMIGSVLEEHLRQLCQKNNVDTHIIKGADTVPKRAEAMNIDLVKAKVYPLTDQKQVTAWLDLRNNAAHGKYLEYKKEQVDLMYQGVLNFISRVN